MFMVVYPIIYRVSSKCFFTSQVVQEEYQNPYNLMLLGNSITVADRFDPQICSFNRCFLSMKFK